MKKLKEIWSESHLKGVITLQNIREIQAFLNVTFCQNPRAQQAFAGLPKLKHKHGMVSVVQFGFLKIQGLKINPILFLRVKIATIIAGISGPQPGFLDGGLCGCLMCTYACISSKHYYSFDTYQVQTIFLTEEWKLILDLILNQVS